MSSRSAFLSATFSYTAQFPLLILDPRIVLLAPLHLQFQLLLDAVVAISSHPVALDCGDINVYLLILHRPKSATDLEHMTTNRYISQFGIFAQHPLFGDVCVKTFSLCCWPHDGELEASKVVGIGDDIAQLILISSQYSAW